MAELATRDGRALRRGMRVTFDGREHTVIHVVPKDGKVELMRGDGAQGVVFFWRDGDEILAERTLR